MKVQIFVQKDYTALVVPIANIYNKLSEDKERMKSEAVRTRVVDLDDSIIGMDRAGAKKGIQGDGFFVNTFGNASNH